MVASRRLKALFESMFLKKRKQQIKIDGIVQRGLEQFAYRVRAGAGILDAMTGIAVLRNASEALSQGHGVVEALKQAHLLFKESEWELLAIGEEAGSLGEQLLEILKNRKRQRELRRELMGQMIYPAIVVLVCLSVLLVLSVFVIPEMKILFKSMLGDAQLPYMTENIGLIYGALAFVLFISSILVSVVIFGMQVFSKKSSWVSEKYELLLSYIPLFGKHTRDQRQARFCEQLSLMLKAGISLSHAFRRLEKGDWSIQDRKRIKIVHAGIINGNRLSEMLIKSAILDKENGKLIEIGEENGLICDHLETISREIQIHCRWRIQQMTRLLEPALVLVLALLVGGMLSAFLLPLMQLYKSAL